MNAGSGRSQMGASYLRKKKKKDKRKCLQKIECIFPQHILLGKKTLKNIQKQHTVRVHGT